MKLQSLNTFIQTTIKKGNTPEKRLEQKSEQHTFVQFAPLPVPCCGTKQHLVGGFWRKNVAPFMESSSDLRQLKL